MSKHKEHTLMSVVDRALGSQKRATRLQKLLITITVCFVAVVAALSVVIAHSGGHIGLSAMLGTVVSAQIIWKGLKKAFPALKKSP